MHTGNGEITYFRNKTEFGYDYTALMPIMNSAGESVAILAVDISVNEIRTVLTQYIISDRGCDVHPHRSVPGRFIQVAE